MEPAFLERIDGAGIPAPLPPGGIDAALRQGEALHREVRPRHIGADYITHLRQMAREGAHLTQLVHEGEVCAIAVWRTYLTTYVGRRFEIDDLVTAEGERSKGHGATLLAALEAKARSLACDAVLLVSGTWRVDAHRFYFRQRFTINAFQFIKELG